MKVTADRLAEDVLTRCLEDSESSGEGKLIELFVWSGVDSGELGTFECVRGPGKVED